MDSSLACVDFLGAGAFRLMLSSESLLLALNSGCLNSHAYGEEISRVTEQQNERALTFGP